MKNTEIFDDYDMVVSISKKTINEQLMHLVRLGTIRDTLVLVQNIVDRNYVYQVLDSGTQIPRDKDGNPTVSCIDAGIIPQIEFTDSGTNVTFVLSFTSGTAWLWEGNGPMAKLVSFDMTGWKYGIAINLDLKEVEKADIDAGIKVPDLVVSQLTQFVSNMFTVNHLFLDFESTDLMRFDPQHTNTGSAGDTGVDQLVLFMQHYLGNLKATGNPYILGYTITVTDTSKFAADQNVPDQLKPAGTTYTLYADPDHPDLSSLNFVLATKGGHGAIAGTPGNFDSNWLTPDEQCDAKMIYSHSCLVEPFVLSPFFEQLRSTMYAAIKDHIDVPAGHTYPDARKATKDGLAFDISDVTTGDDQYSSTFSASFSSAPGSGADLGRTEIALSGHLALRKEVHKDMGVCQAEAHSAISADWTSTVSLTATKDRDGEPALALDHTALAVQPGATDVDQNDCAKAFEVIGGLLKKFLDALTAGLIELGGADWITDIFDTPVPGLGNIGDVFTNLGNAISTVVILPAGDVFFFKNPSIDPGGNLALELTYKTENS